MVLSALDCTLNHIIVNFKLIVDESGKHVIIVTYVIQHNLGNFLSLPEQPKVFITSVKKYRQIFLCTQPLITLISHAYFCHKLKF